MTKLLRNLKASWKFVHAGLTRFEQSAAFVPSSRFLSQTMVESTSLAHARCLVELGPGVGTVTRAILQAMPAQAHLHLIEIDEQLLSSLITLVHDERLRPIHASAEHLAEVLQRDHGCTVGVDAVFSSLGLSLMPADLRRAIYRNIGAVLRPAGYLVQYSYVHARLFTYSSHEGVSRFRARAFLESMFRSVRSELVVRNIPPAVVYTCQGFREAASAPSGTGSGRRMNGCARR